MSPEKLPPFYRLSPEVALARSQGGAIVALESTVITHGLPHPENIQLARDMEDEVRRGGATPATMAVLDGSLHVGLSAGQLERLVAAPEPQKISPRDFARALVRRESGGTTVAGTLLAAHTAGIRVFATGGIGGVHRGPLPDISADLPQLASTPLVVVCAGAKAVLDLPATLEYLETHAVPVVGFKSEDFPAFYARRSGLKVSVRADTVEEIVQLARMHWAAGLRSALLVAVPPPEEVALPEEEAESAVQQALEAAREAGVRGQAVTPFLLARVAQLTGRASLAANLGLLRNNARVAAGIARALHQDRGVMRA